MADTKSAAEIAKAKADREKKKADSFKKLAGARVTNALKALTSVGNLSAKGSYSYTDEQVAKIEAALTGKVAEVVGAFKTGAPTSSGFSL